jgi:hypothetical protein
MHASKHDFKLTFASPSSNKLTARSTVGPGQQIGTVQTQMIVKAAKKRRKQFRRCPACSLLRPDLVPTDSVPYRTFCSVCINMRAPLEVKHNYVLDDSFLVSALDYMANA